MRTECTHNAIFCAVQSGNGCTLVQICCLAYERRTTKYTSQEVEFLHVKRASDSGKKQDTDRSDENRVIFNLHFSIL